MNIELNPDQVREVVAHVCWKLSTDQEQTDLALRVFARNDYLDPFVALRAVVRQVARQHCLSLADVLKDLK